MKVIDLTPRQADCAAELAADGADDRQIAERLGVSLWTVRTHMQAVRDAAGISNRAALAVALVRRRVVVKVIVPERMRMVP